MISFEGRTLTIDGKAYELEHPIANAVKSDDQVIVLYDPDAFTSKVGQFQNLIAVARNGRIRWKAELPSTTTGDRYYRFTLSGSLWASSVFSEVCEVDLANGRILRKEFVK